ncbi:LexA family transcriptional regulator [Pasteurella atlantica]|uniref:LexA family protein n=1 Tax=Phocoenobacter atlanticus TaxID=3416742 RepID=UPI001E4FBF86|nr:LexA family transcriptional regulator [Pasteurella atlantica]MDP8160248.1 LexA family transcriptional regulator [Pasteurella atlantica]
MTLHTDTKVEQKSLAYRLKTLMTTNKVSIQELSDALGLTYEMIRRYTLGKAEPRTKNLEKIAKYLDTTPAWLQFGEESTSLMRSVPSFSYPLISAVQAGAFTSTYDLQDSEGYEMLDSETATKGESFFLRISGRSMETKFSEGDLVLIDTGRVPQPGNYVAAVNGSGEATFKMYKQLGELSESGNPHFELVPLNSVFPTLSSLKQDIRIIGVAVEHRSYL